MRFLWGVGLVLFSGVALAADLPAESKPHTLDDLLRQWEIRDARLSPDGDYLAVTMPREGGKLILGVFPIGRPKEAKLIQVPTPGEMIGGFEWVSSKRLVITIAKQFGGNQLSPYSTGEIWAVNADGGGFKVLHTWRGDVQTGTKLNHTQSLNSFAFLLDTLKDDDDNVLIYTQPIVENAQEGAFYELYRLNVNSGAHNKIGRAPMRSASFLVDIKGNVRVAYGADSKLNTKVYTRAAEGGDWKLVVDQVSDHLGSWPVGFAGDLDTIYVQREESSGPDSLYRMALADGKLTRVLRDPVSSPQGYYETVDGSDLYGVKFDSGKAAVQLLGKSDEAMLQASLQKAFADELVEIVNFSRDRNFALVLVTSSCNPGDYYRFDRRTKNLDYLSSRGQWLDLQQLAQKRAVELKARDGLPLHGYLTVPRGKAAKDLPLVVWVHGGPHGLRDNSDYDEETQMLAFGGYAVLQLNFRGSGGYGRAFEDAGYGRWGAEMQDDLTDATHWAVEQGIADPGRICIGGASYGGYAAMMGAVREPKLYRCAISYVGVHDLTKMLTRGDINDTEFGESYLEKALGDDEAALLKRSPVANAERIEAAVFIAAGGMDQRVPIVHAKEMTEALDKAGKQYEYMVKEREGHGYYGGQDRHDLYSAMLKFLDAHIGHK